MWNIQYFLTQLSLFSPIQFFVWIRICWSHQLPDWNSNMLIGFWSTLWPQPLWSSVFGSLSVFWFPIFLHAHLGFHFSALSSSGRLESSIYQPLVSAKGLLQELFLLPWAPFPPHFIPSLGKREVPRQLLILRLTFLTSLTSWRPILAPHVPPLPHLVTGMQITVHVLACFC